MHPPPDPLHVFSNELVLLAIAQYLYPQDVGNLAQTCKAMRANLGNMLTQLITVTFPVIARAVRNETPEGLRIPIMQGANKATMKKAFLIACIEGHLGLAQWLEEHGALTPADVTGDDHAVFKYTCKGRNVEVVKWLATKHYPTNRACGITGFGMASSLEIMRWLAEHYKLTRREISAKSAFERACKKGQIEIAEWLLEHFKIPDTDIVLLGSSCDAFIGACGEGHLEMAQWIMRRFNLTYENVAGDYQMALSYARFSRRLEVVKWLKTYLRKEKNKRRQRRRQSQVQPDE